MKELEAAARMALEQLEFLNACYPHKTAADAITALTQALATTKPSQTAHDATAPIRTPAPPFATFDEHGRGCDDKIYDFYCRHSQEVETRAFNRGYDAAQPATTMRKAEPVGSHAESLADALYKAGYMDRNRERDYDPRNTDEWQSVVDAMLSARTN